MLKGYAEGAKSLSGFTEEANHRLRVGVPRPALAGLERLNACRLERPDIRGDARIERRILPAMTSGFIDRFITGRFRPDCWVCGRNDWRVFSTDIDGNPTRIVLGQAWPDGTPIGDYGFAVFTVGCTHCGNVRLIAADPLEGPDDEDEPETEAEPQ